MCLTEIRGGHDALVTASHGCHAAPATEVKMSAYDAVDDTDPTQSALRQRLVQVLLHVQYRTVIANSLTISGVVERERRSPKYFFGGTPFPK